MKVFEKNIRKVEPYVPGEQPQRKVIKLNKALKKKTGNLCFTPSIKIHMISEKAQIPDTTNMILTHF